MKGSQSSLAFKFVLLYAALSIILAISFGIDISGWWAIPVYESLGVVIKGIVGMFH